ncbi:hypothetical protein BC830DRAFT_57963, partial [Chytriomyces sp. MP71]
MKLLALATVLCTSAPLIAAFDLCASARSALTFNPPLLSYREANFGAPFNVTLTEQPASDFAIALKAQGFYFDKASVSFNATNWNQPQQVLVVASPGFAVDYDEQDVPFSVLIGINAPCSLYHKCEFEYQGQRDYVAGRTCTSSGDPHQKTFDDLSYCSVSEGTHYLVKNEHLQVQAYQFPCIVAPGTNGTCNGGISVRYGDAIVMVTLDDSTPFTCAPARIQTLSPSLPGLSYTPSNGKPSTQWQVVLDDGSSVTIMVGCQNGVQWLDASIFLGGSYSARTAGLCNRHTQSDNKRMLVCSTGELLSSDSQAKVDHFVSTWRVEDTENHFAGKWVSGSCTHPFKPFWGADWRLLVNGFSWSADSYGNCVASSTSPTTSSTTAKMSSASGLTMSTLSSSPGITASTSSIGLFSATQTTVSTSEVDSMSASSSGTSTSPFVTTDTTKTVPASTTSPSMQTGTMISTTAVVVASSDVTGFSTGSSQILSSMTYSTSSIPSALSSTSSTSNISTPVGITSSTAKSTPTTSFVTTISISSTSYTTLPGIDGTRTYIPPVQVYTPTCTLQSFTVPPNSRSHPAPVTTSYSGPTPTVSPFTIYKEIPIYVPTQQHSAYDLQHLVSYCESALTIEAAHDICPGETNHYVASCISDMLSISSPAFVEAYKLLLNSICSSHSDYNIACSKN